MSEMNTARPRIPSPLETAGIFVRPCVPPVDSRALRKKTLLWKFGWLLLVATSAAVVERQREPRYCVDWQTGNGRAAAAYQHISSVAY